ncbi:MAG: hypothetical protein RJA81_2166 [Planctomycetota bacterium]
MTGKQRNRAFFYRKIGGNDSLSQPELSFSSTEITLDRWGDDQNNTVNLELSSAPSSEFVVNLTASDTSVTVSPSQVTFSPGGPISVGITLTGAMTGPNQVVLTASSNLQTVAPVTLLIQRPSLDIPVLNGLQLWLRSDYGTIGRNGQSGLTDLNPVAQWRDCSGFGRDLYQGQNGQQPVFRTSSQNGLPGIAFDGLDDMLEFSNTLNLNNFSIYWVGKILESPSNGSAYFHGVNGNYAANHYSMGLYWYQGVDIVTGANGSVTQNNPLKIAIYRSGSSWQYYVNGVSQTVSGNSMQAIIKGIGRAYTGYSNMVLNEAVIYSRSLTSAERGAINTYLSRWGV